MVVATRSAHKLRELRDLLRLAEVDLVSLESLGIPGEPIEDGLTFETNAKIKARFATRATGLPALADDSGLEVDALGGLPGVRTRRYAGPDATDAQNNAKLLAELAGVAPAARGARYVCVLALALPDPTAPGGLRIVTRRGTSRGRIGIEARGTRGFGYDPLFEPARERAGGRTFGQYAAGEKNAISHRGRAARRMVPVLRGLRRG
jgi:XTP/dITP diphosphohydrolase